MRKRIELVTIVVVGIIAACGGQVQGTHRECPSDPSNASCSSGDTCSLSVPGCNGQTSAVSCSCENGYFACPDIGIACPPTTPPSPADCTGVTPGAACGSEGQSCPNTQFPKCGDVVYPCTCTNSRWQCPQPTCPQCADPKTIHAGANCGGQGPMSCPGTDECGGQGICTCMGPSWIWYCSGGCVDGGGPPDASTD